MTPMPVRSQHNLEVIKASVSCVDIARSLGLDPAPDGAGWRCRAFRPGAENPTSMYLTERWWCDFGAGAGQSGGDVIDLVAQAQHAGNRGAAIRALAVIAGLSPSDVPTDHHFDRVQKLGELFHEKLTPGDREYLHQRGITDATIDALKLGHGTTAGMEDRITIPYWRGGRMVYMCGRTLLANESAKYKKLPLDKAWGDHPVWGYDTLSRGGRVIIAEGAFDALACWQEGMAVVSAITGRFSHEQLTDLYDILAGRDATICFDFDPVTHAGQHFTEALARKLIGHGIRTSVVLLKPDASGGKSDLADLYARGENIHELLATAQPFQAWEVDRLAQLTDADARKKSLTDFATAFAKRFPWGDVAEVLELAQQSKAWEKPWLAALRKQLSSPPSDVEIVTQLLQDHQLIYTETLGWYEYNAAAGVWESRVDTAVMALLAGLWGQFKNGARINSSHTVAKATAHFAGDFNACRHLLNFQNGMLDLNTMELGAHNPEYYSTIQLGYSYDPEAVSVDWLDAIMEITQGDAERLNLLQIMFGYCLSGNPIYEKAFVLLGGGANGKSVVLHVLTHMLGERNVSNVPLAAMAENFERIRLLGKLANISTETNSDVRGVSEILKQVVSCDTITGAHKYRNTIEFVPRCVCIFATNSLQESEDTSHGFLRKLHFVQFPVTFSDNPGPGQVKKVAGLRDTLATQAHLPGICNWALEGLAKLRALKGIPETADHKAVSGEFKLQNNPVLDWLVNRPSLAAGWHLRTECYNEYKKWCEANGRKSLSSHKFYSRMRNVPGISEKKASEWMFFLPERDDARCVA